MRQGVAVVYMNRGRWVIDCPREDCTWAYLAMTEDGRPRYQHACVGTRDNPGCGQQIELAWPPMDAALEVERLLYMRSAALNRNWRWPETVDGLDRENEQLLVGWNLDRLVDAGIGVE